MVSSSASILAGEAKPVITELAWSSHHFCQIGVMLISWFCDSLSCRKNGKRLSMLDTFWRLLTLWGVFRRKELLRALC